MDSLQKTAPGSQPAAMQRYQPADQTRNGVPMFGIVDTVAGTILPADYWFTVEVTRRAALDLLNAGNAPRGKVFCLVFGEARLIVLNSMCPTWERLNTLLADRIANGEAFNGERCATVSVAAYLAYHAPFRGGL